MQRAKPKSKFKDIFNSWFLVFEFGFDFCSLRFNLFSYKLLTFYIFTLHFGFLILLDTYA